MERLYVYCMRNRATGKLYVCIMCACRSIERGVIGVLTS